MRPQSPAGCYCHTLKDLAAAAVQGIDLHATPEPADATSNPAIALNNDTALAGIAGGKPVKASHPAWATDFQNILNNQEN